MVQLGLSRFSKFKNEYRYFTIITIYRMSFRAGLLRKRFKIRKTSMPCVAKASLGLRTTIYRRIHAISDRRSSKLITIFQVTSLLPRIIGSIVIFCGRILRDQSNRLKWRNHGSIRFTAEGRRFNWYSPKSIAANHRYCSSFDAPASV